MVSLSVLTLNVRGLADPAVWRQLFYLLRQWPVDICCLQEVHASPSDADFWSLEWGQPASWNNYTAILFKSSLRHITFDVLYDGRVLSSTFRWQGKEYRIANIYMPAQRAQRCTFLSTFTSDFSSLFSTFDFLVGDWNMFRDPHRDCVRTSTHQATPALLWPLLAPCLTMFVDAAFTGASVPYYTFESTMYQYQACLDHVFVHARHALSAMNTSLYPFSRSDHTGVIVQFSDTVPSSSPLLYRLNTSLLSSPNLRSLTLSCLEPLHSSYHIIVINSLSL